MSKAIPEIRYKGFNNEWTSNKLGEIIDISSASRVHKEEWKNEGVPFFRSSDVISKYMKKYNNPAFISDALYQELSQKSGKMKVDDILVTGGGTIGVPYLIENENPLYFKDADLIWLKNSGVIDGSFLYNFYISPQTRRYISSITHIGTISHYTIVQGKNTPISLPVKSEQEKIGTLFKMLDETIALQQQLVEQRQQYKKAMLQKMFPQKGERVPKVRFDGFSEDWKVTKLEEIVDRVTRKNSKLESTLPLTISAQHGLVDQITFFNKQVASKDVSSYFLLEKGDFAYNKSYSKGFPWGAVKRLDKYEKGVLSTLYIVFIPKRVNSDFLVSYYDTNLWHKEVSMRAAEGARNHGLLNITAKDFFETELKIPSTAIEQQKIGTFFKQLDDTIALHEKKLKDYQQLKKALLQRMFV